MRPKVILRHCATYDPAAISRIILEGLDELGLQPHGRTLVKPNTVIAHPRYFPHAFTRAEFLDGLLSALQQRGAAIRELTVGERCGITIPTRYAFAQAGYRSIIRKHAARTAYFDEEPQVPRSLQHPQALRREIFIPQTIASTDFLVNAPKLKAHPWTKMTCALKNYIGLQDDRHRLIDHDYALHTKIVDLQEVIRSDFIAVDGIIAGQKTMLTPRPFQLGLILMATNSVALDAIAARILGLEPDEVDHLRLAHQRELGPIDLDEIELSGDVTLDEARSRASGFGLTLERVDQIFNGHSNLHIYNGPPPDETGGQYCWGGCPGALFEAMQIIQAMQPNVYREVKPMHFVFGDYRGQVAVQAGEPVLLVGDCVQFAGTIKKRSVEARSTYLPRQQHDPHHAKSGDVVNKMIRVVVNRLRQLGQPAIRVRGCPVSVAEHTLYLSLLGKTRNPYLAPSIAFPFAYYYLVSKLATWWKRGRMTQRGTAPSTINADQTRA